MGSRQSTQAKISQTPRASGGRGGGGEARAGIAASAARGGRRCPLWSLLAGLVLLAAAGACVFALHPTHPESVDFIAGRTDLLSGAFLFATLWAAARWGPRIRNAWLKLWPSSIFLLLS